MRVCVVPWLFFSFVVSVLYVCASYGFSLNDSGYAISASVQVWSVRVVLMTNGITLTCFHILFYCSIACLSVSYIFFCLYGFENVAILVIFELYRV